MWRDAGILANSTTGRMVSLQKELWRVPLQKNPITLFALDCRTHCHRHGVIRGWTQFQIAAAIDLKLPWFAATKAKRQESIGRKVADRTNDSTAGFSFGINIIQSNYQFVRTLHCLGDDSLVHDLPCRYLLISCDHRAAVPKLLCLRRCIYHRWRLDTLGP